MPIPLPVKPNARAFSEHCGLTAAQYAAIHLRVPASGTPWLDNMIATGRRMEIAAAALGGFDIPSLGGTPNVVMEAYEIADEFMKEQYWRQFNE